MSLPALALADGPALLAVLWAWVLLNITVVAIYRRWRLDRRRQPAIDPAPPASPLLLVRPCAGHEPDLEARLLSVARARYNGELRVVIAVRDVRDGALPAVQRAVAGLRAVGFVADVHVGALAGPNHKVGLLASVEATFVNGVRSDAILVSADSDVDLDGYDLDALVAPISRDARVGATWAPPVEVDSPQSSLGDRALRGVLGGSLHAFGLLCALDRHALVGKMFAARTSALTATGGFAGLIRHLGEDMELARRLRRAGLRVDVVPTPVRARAAVRSLREVIDRQARWMAVIRAQRPHLLATYPLLFAPWPLLLPLCAGGAVGHPTISAAAAVLAVTARLLAALAAQHWSGRRPGLGAALVDSVLADLVIWPALARALRCRRVRWRGRVIRFGADGLLVEDGADQ